MSTPVNRFNHSIIKALEGKIEDDFYIWETPDKLYAVKARRLGPSEHGDWVLWRRDIQPIERLKQTYSDFREAVKALNDFLEEERKVRVVQKAHEELSPFNIKPRIIQL